MPTRTPSSSASQNGAPQPARGRIFIHSYKRGFPKGLGSAPHIPCHLLNPSPVLGVERERCLQGTGSQREAAGRLGKRLPTIPPAAAPQPCQCHGHLSHMWGDPPPAWAPRSAVSACTPRAVSTSCPWLLETRTRASGTSRFFNGLCGPFGCCKIQWRSRGLKPGTSPKLEALLTSKSKAAEHTALPGEDPRSSFFLTLTVWCRHLILVGLWAQ